MPATVAPGSIAAVATATLSPADRMSQGSLSTYLLPEKALAALAKCALILFFIYNKHFEVNGNIVLRAGEAAATGARNKIRVATDRLLCASDLRFRREDSGRLPGERKSGVAWQGRIQSSRRPITGMPLLCAGCGSPSGGGNRRTTRHQAPQHGPRHPDPPERRRHHPVEQAPENRSSCADREGPVSVRRDGFFA